MQAFPQRRGTEIDQQTYRAFRQLEVGEQLFAVNRRQSLHGFEFHDDSGINEKINPESFLEDHPLIIETEDRLPLDLKSPLNEDPSQHGLVHRFQQPRAQVTMDLERGVHYTPRNVIELAHPFSLRALRDSA
jgi:hypothetical protein